MFGGGRRRGGLLGGLLGSNRYYQQPRRRGLLNNPLGQMALIAGAGWMARRFFNNRGQGNMSGMGGSNIDSGSGSADWNPNNQGGSGSW